MCYQEEEPVWSTESPGGGEAEANLAMLRGSAAGGLLGGMWVWGKDREKCGWTGVERGRKGYWKNIFALAGEFEGNREIRARCSTCDQSIVRLSPCFFVNSSAFLNIFLRSFEYSSARSALKGCSGWGSLTRAMRDWMTWVLVAG